MPSIARPGGFFAVVQVGLPGLPPLLHGVGLSPQSPLFGQMTAKVVVDEGVEPPTMR